MKFVVPVITLIFGGVLGYFFRPLEAKRGDDREVVTLRSLSEITGNKFSFATVIEDTCEVGILKPAKEHNALMRFIPVASMKVAEAMSRPDSPARAKRRINEVSALFENALRIEIDEHPDFTCSFPKTKEGELQRSGYPDLRVEHLPSKTVVYLDPKLFEETSIKSSFRTFYYEPSHENSKVTEDALHLLIGFPHDGRTREWTFGKPRLVDLSDLTVTLKTEFSASNRELYRN